MKRQLIILNQVNGFFREARLLSSRLVLKEQKMRSFILFAGKK